MSQKTAALLIPGCGVFDGAEIMETTSMVFALHEHGWNVQAYAPNRNFPVLNHTTGETSTTETRNILVEASRIVRGDIKDITSLSA